MSGTWTPEPFEADEQTPTVRRVVEHVGLIQDVDTSHPIILGPDNRMIDGVRRGSVEAALCDSAL